MFDFSLKFVDEAQAHEVLTTLGFIAPEFITVPVLVTDTALQATLDALPLADAQLDQTVTHEGKTYMADAGQWFELVERRVFQCCHPSASVDVIGRIYRNTAAEGEEPVMVATDGYHVNVRTFEDAPELVAYQVFPVTPVRVWA